MMITTSQELNDEEPEDLTAASAFQHGEDLSQRRDQECTVYVTTEDYNDYYSSWTPLSLPDWLEERSKASNSGPTEEVHLKNMSRTILEDGNSMLLDLGSVVNVIGENTEEAFAQASSASGRSTTYTPRPQPLRINGVGSDAAVAHVMADIPIAVKYKDRDATEEVFQANVATGCGKDLPAILGLKSMQDKNAVLILQHGNEFMAFPGKGGYQITWSAGTKLLPLVHAPSGHLVIPCDKFKELPSQKNTTTQLTFVTDHRVVTMQGAPQTTQINPQE